MKSLAQSLRLLVLITSILMNGHTLGAGKYTGSAGYFFDVIPVDNIRRIEIIRGPGSALYGSDAF
ncbi:MAG: TonB-dependent receptor plug domain-containing protein, partial [Desulfobacterales bacterium]|nr:TonB-dependent receptor plug domain-containing protein [Desulfobacterales bacterium]